MISQLAKFYGLPPREAETLDEIDFWIMREFGSLEQQRAEYIMNLKLNKE